MNKQFLIGNAGKDVEVNDKGNMAKFSLATTESWKNKEGEWVNETEWHNVYFFGKQVEYAKKIQKGDMVWIEGKFKSREYEGKRYHQTNATSFKILKKNETSQAKPAPATEGAATTHADDLPF